MTTLVHYHQEVNVQEILTTSVSIPTPLYTTPTGFGSLTFNLSMCDL